MITFCPEAYHDLNILCLQKDVSKSVWTGQTSMNSIYDNLPFPDIIIRDDASELSIPATDNIMKITGISDIPLREDLLHVENGQSSLDLSIPTAKDNLYGPGGSMSKLEEILSSEEPALEHFKGFTKQRVLTDGEFITFSPLRAVEYYLMDLLFTEELLLFKNIQTFVQYSLIPNKSNAAAARILSDEGVDSYTQTQIKKLFFLYCAKLADGQKTIDLLETYPILEAVIEIVLMNYFCDKLSKERFDDLYQQYQQDNMVPGVLYEDLCRLFEIKYQAKKNVHVLKFKTSSIVVKHEHTSFRSHIE